MPKQDLLKLVALKRKDGNDADLLLLKLVNKLESEVAAAKEELQQRIIETDEKIPLKIKGEKGDAPTREELLSLIEPLIPTAKDGKTPTRKELLKIIKPLIPLVEDGKTPTQEELTALIKPLIPPPGKDADEEAIVSTLEGRLPTMGETFRDGLELLQGDERLDESAIKGLEELIKRVAGPRVLAVGGSGGGKGVLPALPATTTITEATYTASVKYGIILADATSNNITITLPSALSIAGFEFHIYKVDSSTNTVTIDPAGSETINQGSTSVINFQSSTLVAISTGSNWIIT